MAAVTKVDVANRALAVLGQIGADKIEDFEELTSDGRAVRRFWDTTLEAFLEEHWWSFATKYATLTLKETNPSPPEWGYAYVAPEDMASPRRIVGYVPEESVPYELASIAGVPVVYTNKQLACMEYTALIEDFSLWPGVAIRAFSLALAVEMSPAFSGGVEKIGLFSQLAADALDRARVVSHNTQERDPYEMESTELTDTRHGTVRSIRHQATFRRG
jgi:hypothetical protein